MTVTCIFSNVYRLSVLITRKLALEKGRLVVKGRETSWIGPDSWELGITKEERDPRFVVPRISDRVILFWNKT